VHAPNLTALAEDAAVFESAYCPAPLCAPSRAGLLSARLPSRGGVFDNAAEMPASLPTVTHQLRAHGYYTGLVGKMHFVGPDQLHGFEERLTPDIYPGDLDWTPDWRLPAGEQLAWYHTMESVLEPAVSVASMQQDYDDEVAFRAVRKIFDLAREDDERPFFLVVSFSNPHDPWELPQRYWDLYDRDAIDLPAVPLIPLAEADPHSRRLRAMCGVDEVDLGPRRPARLLRGDQLPGRASGGGARRPAGCALRRGHDRGLHRRPRRDARRAGPLVQDVVLRALGARALARPRTGRLAAPSWRAGVAAGPGADAARAHGRPLAG
jgi:choline-sulfatase